MIPAGGAATVEFKVNVPGTYILVDHSLTRAFNKGALGQLKVEGGQDKLVYSGKISDEVYLPEGANVRTADDKVQAAPKAQTKEERIAHGKNVYMTNCAACHQPDGVGVEAAFPPLARADYLNADKVRAIKVVTGGLTGKITVNGKDYNSVMPAWNLSDEEIANVLTFVYANWNNAGFEIKPEEVKAHRVAPNLDGAHP
jgi:nitrite reductase (NO-forming)